MADFDLVNYLDENPDLYKFLQLGTYIKNYDKIPEIYYENNNQLFCKLKIVHYGFQSED